MQKTVILGNGASNRFYTGNTYAVACNIPQHGHRYQGLSIIDPKTIVFMKNSGWRPRTPVFCTEQIRNVARKHNIEGDFFPVYDTVPRKNSGHHAVTWMQGFSTEIHLYGFDSIFSDDLTSQCDAVIPRHTRPPLNKYWHPIWQEILEQIQIPVILHLPKGAKPRITHEKLKTVAH